MTTACFKSMLKRTVANIFSLAGIHAAFALKRKNSDLTILDRNAVEAFYNKDSRISLYYKALSLVGQDKTDNIYKQCRSYTLQQMVEHCITIGIEGDVAECGCWKGQSSHIISTILRANGFSGTFHIFDSFEGGLSDKQVEDNNQRVTMDGKAVQDEKQFFASSESDLHHALAGFNFYRLYKGWIPDRFHEVADRTFSFVHVDVDLFQPTLDSLSFFWPRLSDGGVLIVDDYGYTQFPGAKKAVDQFLADKKYRMFFAYPLGGCFIIK